MAWKQVAAYSDRFEAGLVVSRLREVGIQAYMAADDLAGAFPLMHLSEGGCRIYVPVHRAGTAIREITRIGGHATDTWAAGARRKASDVERTRRIAYIVAVIVGWCLGYTPWPTLLSVVLR
jgi:hypothetical protein